MTSQSNCDVTLQSSDHKTINNNNRFQRETKSSFNAAFNNNNKHSAKQKHQSTSIAVSVSNWSTQNKYSKPVLTIKAKRNNVYQAMTQASCEVPFSKNNSCLWCSTLTIPEKNHWEYFAVRCSGGGWVKMKQLCLYFQNPFGRFSARNCKYGMAWSATNTFKSLKGASCFLHEGFKTVLETLFKNTCEPIKILILREAQNKQGSCLFNGWTNYIFYVTHIEPLEHRDITIQYDCPDLFLVAPCCCKERLYLSLCDVVQLSGPPPPGNVISEQLRQF